MVVSKNILLEELDKIIPAEIEKCSYHPQVYEIREMITNESKSSDIESRRFPLVSLIRKEIDISEKTKLGLQAKLNMLTSNAQNTRMQDNMAPARSLLQKNLLDFNKKLQNRNSDFIKPVQGSFWNINKMITGDIELQRIAKVKHHELRLSQETKTQFLSAVESEIRKQAGRDISIYLESVRETVLKAADVNPFHPSDQIAGAITDEKLQTILQYILRFDNEFEGNIRTRKFKDYVFEARSYAMLFLILLSTFGLYDAKRNYSFLLGVAGAMLLVWGAYDTYVNDLTETAELMAEEKEKARTYLKAEAKRIVSEFQTEWTKLLQNEYTKFAEDYLAATEEAVTAKRNAEKSGFEAEKAQVEKEIGMLTVFVTTQKQFLESLIKLPLRKNGNDTK